MIVLKVDNSFATVVGRLAEDRIGEEEILSTLRLELGYTPPGIEHSPKVKLGEWDGVISLWQRGARRAPTGLTFKIRDLLKEFGHEVRVEDHRIRPVQNLQVSTRFEALGIVLRWYQEEAVKRVMANARGTVALFTGAGKSISISEEILTERGWTTMGEVVDGDHVFDERGQLCEVIKAHDVMHGRECFEVEFSHGERIVVDGDHLWTVRFSKGYDPKMRSCTLSTSEIKHLIESGECEKTTQRKKKLRVGDRSMLFIEAPKALCYESKLGLPINPYVLGAWLGDGSRCDGGFTNVDGQIIDEIRASGYTIKQSSCAEKEWGIHKLAKKLKKLNLIGNKHIPWAYKSASFEVRLALLQGIVDTDGTVSRRKNGAVEISLSDELLAQDVYDLVRGLGIPTTKTSNQAWLKGSRHKDRHRIKFTTNIPVARLARKRERLPATEGRDTKRRFFIKSIRAVKSRPVRCLTVNSPSCLYLVGRSLIPTHNTALTCELAAQMKVAPVVFVVPSKSLMYQTARAFRKFLLIDGQVPEVGLIGDGHCSVNPKGINVLIYHSGLAAFDLTYDKAKDAVKESANAGERERKSTEDLDRDLRKSQKVLKAAITKHGNPARGKHEDVKKAKAAYDKAKLKLNNRHKNLANKEKIRDLFAEAQAVVVDEAHLAAVVLQTLCEKATKAWYKVALSATPWRSDGQDIRIQAATGKKLIELTPKDGIDLGYLVPIDCYFVRESYSVDGKGLNEVYQKNIVENWAHNYRIKRFAEEFHEAGYPVHVRVDRIEHGEYLESIIQNSLFVSGSDDGGEDEDETLDDRDYRKRVLDELAQNKVILITTNWADQGIDVPELRVLIQGGSFAAASRALQYAGRGARTLGPNIEQSIANGKPNCIYIDFMMEHPMLRKQSNARKEVMRKAEFELKYVS
jgi:superfamily II DNA or RNA helicase